MHSTKYLLAIIVLVGIFTSARSAAARSVTHEEIKDALINFMHVVRSNTEKLERHENRERQLGELLKRALSALDKKGRAQEAVLDKILEAQQSMSDRLEKMERVLSEQEDAARGTYTVDSIPGQSMITQIEAMVDKRIDKATNGDRLNELESSVTDKMDYLASVIEKLQANTYNTNHRLESLAEKLTSRENLENMLVTMEKNTNLVHNVDKKVETLLKNPTTGVTGDFGDIKKEIATELSNVKARLENGLDTLAESVARQERAMEMSVLTSRDVIESKLNDLKTKFEDLTKETKAIGNVEQVLVKTADDVMDTKRRVEHGIYQIRSEVNDYVKSSQGGNEYNDTVVNKFTGMAETILENQSGTVANLSAKVESEISQVWRQIGIMHQQITASGLTLDNLQNQTNTFVKDTENKMDTMSSRLEYIGSQVDLMNENNNFLVGRFSLFTHEFNETRGSLAQTTKDLRTVLKAVKLHSIDSSPGPHNIDSSPDGNMDSNKL